MVLVRYRSHPFRIGAALVLTPLGMHAGTFAIVCLRWPDETDAFGAMALLLLFFLFQIPIVIFGLTGLAPGVRGFTIANAARRGSLRNLKE
jgi:hypothetical protein